MVITSTGFLCFLFSIVVVCSSPAIHDNSTAVPVTTDLTAKDGLIDHINVECNHQEMILTISTSHSFHGMVYPRGLTKTSSCMVEYDVAYGHSFIYKVPLRSCNTMFNELDDHLVEYYNTIIVQPHRKLVTNQGRGYEIRCKYPTKDTAIISGIQVRIAGKNNTKTGTPLPGTVMHIYSGDGSQHVTVENVKIGDPLTLIVALDEQDIFGMKVTDCSVHDGLGWSEQLLYNEQGCPIDNDLMGPMDYNSNRTLARVHFQAHKFPYTASVYYQCHVRLCLRHGGCEDVPPLCDMSGNNLRRKRDVSEPIAEYRIDQPEFAQNATIEVFRGFYVTDTTDGKDTRLFTGETLDEVNDDQLCISPRDFAIGIAVAGLILMMAIIAAILVLCSRRRRKRVSSTTGSSVYSGPYTNTAYSHSS